jgi:hypothetical protein
MTQPKSDTQWQKESDAHTLAEAERIKADPTRMKGAQTAAKKILTEKQKEVNQMAKIAGKSTAKGSRKK